MAAKAERKSANKSKATPARKQRGAKASRGARKNRGMPAASKGWPKQTFLVNHLRGDDDFDAGLRIYSAYRDLGLARATGGRVQAHVIRMTKPYDAKDAGSTHYHDVEFQMVYVLKGWFSSDFDGQGTQTFRAGSCWIQPPRIKHTVIGYSDDCELLEIVLPAEFDTVTLP